MSHHTACFHPCGKSPYIAYTQSELRTVLSHTRFVGFGLRQPSIEFDACLSQGLDQVSDMDVFSVRMPSAGNLKPFQWQGIPA